MAIILDYIIWIFTFGKYIPYNTISTQQNNNMSNDFLLVDISNDSFLTENEYDQIITKNNSNKVVLPIKNDILNFKFSNLKNKKIPIKKQLTNINTYDSLINEIKKKKQLNNTLLECSDGTKLSYLDNAPDTTDKIKKYKL